MERVKYVFIVLVYRNVDDILQFISSVDRLKIEKKIIIVNSYYDEESKEKFIEIADKNNCEFLNIENKGYGYGNNRGIEYANENFDYEYIIISNPDIVIKQFNDENLEKYNDCIIGPIINTARGKSQNPYWYLNNCIGERLIYIGYKELSKIKLYAGIILNKLIRELFLIKFNSSRKNESKVFALHGSFVIVPRKVIKQIGLPYNEEMFLFAEEAYLAHLLKQNNIKSFITKDISVLHKEDGSVGISNINEKSEIRKSVIKYYEKVKGLS